MRAALPACGALAAALLAAPAAAQDVATAPPGALTIEADATLVTDYRYRGVSRSDRRPAAQGSVTVSHASGFYASLWGSTIHGYAARGADAELDLIAGYRTTSGAVTLDGGLLYYAFPGARGGATGFFEPYASLGYTLGPVTAKASASYAWRQRALALPARPGSPREDGLYLAGDVSAAIPARPFAITAHVGRSIGPSRLTARAGTARGYADWSLGGAWTRGIVTLGLRYVDTDARFVTPSGRNAGGAGALLSAGVAF